MHPERGATGWDASCPSWRRRFNSRTREGCDTNRLVDVSRSLSFNSRTREGCDGEDVPPREAIYIVSIHAPGRGATRVRRTLGRGLLSFNSRTREGCDHCAYATSPSSLQFQFTHPGGVRPETLHRNTPMKSFNSRTREGCDEVYATNPEQWGRFQFTHPGGVRRSTHNPSFSL